MAAAVEDFHRRHPDFRCAPVAVVIAAYNEAGAIGSVLSAVPDRSCGLEVDTVVVVDGDEDGTTEVVARYPVSRVVLERNCGHGVALRVGYRLAREAGARYIVTLDGDGQWDPRQIDEVLQPVVAGEADFVVGSRRLGASESADRFRAVGVRFFSALVRVLTGRTITDTSSGFRAMRVEVTAEVPQRQVQYQTAELLLGAIYLGYRVTERPVVMHPRLAGRSKKGHNALYAGRYAWSVLAGWWRARRASSAAHRSGSAVALPPG